MRNLSILLASLLLLMNVGALAQNLVRNGGFEQTNAGSWVLDESAMRNGATARMDSSLARAGKASLLLDQARPLVMPGGWKQSPRLLAFLSEQKAGGYAVAAQKVSVDEGHAYHLRFWYRSVGLVREHKDDPRHGYAAFQVFVDWLDSTGKRIAGPGGTFWVLNEQIGTEGEWAQIIDNHFNKGRWRSYIAPTGARFAVLRFVLSTMQPDVSPKAWVDDVVFEDADSTDEDNSVSAGDIEDVPLDNAGFETTDGAGPREFKTIGSATTLWVEGEAHSGKKCVQVSDAGDGMFSGWYTEVPLRADREYRVSSFIKTGVIAPYGSVLGACASLQFIDKDGQRIGAEHFSKFIASSSDWTQSQTRFARPPAAAVKARIVVGLQYCKGLAMFDDVSLQARPVAPDAVARVVRPDPKPSEGIQYAPNLLTNGDIEQNEGGQPRGWTYVGSSEKNWTPEQIAAFHRESRPAFSIGRGKGMWSHDEVYSGRGALLDVSIDPPLSTHIQFYGQNPVDGYWLSDAMPCEARKAYLAGGWIRPGSDIRLTWLGPLQIRFYDAAGKELLGGKEASIRPGIVGIPAGEWSYWATLPYIAPPGAVKMRLRFGHELKADAGGWGKTYADNLAVWELPPGVSPENGQSYSLRTESFWQWFRAAHARVKPPYLPSPVDARVYTSLLGWVENSTVGNLFFDPSAKVTLKVALANQLGESRTVSVRLKRYDWLGNTEEPVEISAVELKGYSESTVEVLLPPSGSYGAFYIQGSIREGDAVVGEFSGRYGVLPALKRKSTVENVWAVTTLAPFYGDGRAFESELGEVLKIAGFGITWINIAKDDDAQFSKTMREVEWCQAHGLRPVLRINPLQITRPIDSGRFFKLGAQLGETFKGKVAAFGNWGVEQANARTITFPAYRPILDGRMLSDEEYDTILSALYDGIKSTNTQTPVLIGNIATEHDGKVVRRLYGKPAEGRFDGAIINAYSAAIRMAQSVINEFDAHGDTQKQVWLEESPDQTSPCRGPARRRGEAEGPRNMVRVWIALKATIGPRLKAITMWGFCTSHFGGEGDTVMMTPSLQPRPHYVAHAVMADALADATLVADESQANLAVYRWKRTDGPLYTLWANSGERSISFEAPAGQLTVMDLMGNRTQLKAAGGIVSVAVTASPIYVMEGGDLKISNRLETRLENGTLKAGEPQVRLVLTNRTEVTMAGEVVFDGPVLDASASRSFKVNPRETVAVCAGVRADLPTDHRTSFSAECITSDGGTYVATAALNFAVAVRTATPPGLDGTWKDWSTSVPIEFGTRPSEVFEGYGIAGAYTGVQDISGAFRMLWDENYLYLGVESFDDSFHPQPVRGVQGFAGDSIEFACQPENQLSPLAPYREFELYLPDAKPPAAASRRTPQGPQVISHWKASITPTGKNGNVIYQAAIPWNDLGVAGPAAGKVISFALVLNDSDTGDRMTGGRTRVRWFEGIDLRKTAEKFGDVVLVDVSK